MLKLSHAKRLYTDHELLEKAANYFYGDQAPEVTNMDCELLAYILGYHMEYVKGYLLSNLPKKETK